MAIGGFLQGLGLAYGNSLIQGTNLEQKQASADLLKTEAQQAQIQTQKMQQQMKTEQDLGDFISSQTKLEGADATNPLNQARMYAKAAGIAAADGDFESSRQMSALAKQATDEARDQQVALIQQQQVKKEDLANTAQDYSANPTPDAAKTLVQKAIAAGVNPASIPLPNSPKFAAWVNQQQLAGMDSKSKAEFVQKAADLKASRDMKWQEHEDNVGLRQATMQQTAAYRDGMLDLRRAELADKAQRDPKIITIGQDQYEFDASGQMKGDRLATDPRFVKVGAKTTGQQARDTIMLAGAGAEAARNLGQMGKFTAGTTQSPFTHLANGDVSGAVAVAGTNALTPQEVQLFQVSTSGLAQELSRIITAGGGRSGSDAQINELKRQINPAAGDTGITALYKMSTAAQIAVTRLENQPPPADPALKERWDHTMLELRKFPTPDQIYDAANGKQKDQLNNMQGSYEEKLQSIAENSGGSSAAPSGATVSQLPAGWSVKEH